MTTREIQGRLGHIIYELTCVQGPEETPEVKVAKVTHRLKAMYGQLEADAEPDDLESRLSGYRELWDGLIDLGMEPHQPRFDGMDAPQVALTFVKGLIAERDMLKIRVAGLLEGAGKVFAEGRRARRERDDAASEIEDIKARLDELTREVHSMRRDQVKACQPFTHEQWTQ